MKLFQIGLILGLGVLSGLWWAWHMPHDTGFYKVKHGVHFVYGGHKVF